MNNTNLSTLHNSYKFLKKHLEQLTNVAIYTYYMYEGLTKSLLFFDKLNSYQD